jgi:hypothetical protein
MPENEPAIWPPHEMFYLQSMLFNASSAVDSIDRVTDLVQAIDGMSEDNIRSILDPSSLLDELKNVVLQAGALSRYFWPVRKKPEHIRRAERLRWAFGIDEASPLHSRDLRNSIEHFDERLDIYLRGEVVGVILPEYVGMRPVGESIPYHLFRAYYLDDGTFSLLGEEYSMPALVDEVLRIHDRLIELDSSGGSLRAPNGSDGVGSSTQMPNER